MSKCEPLLRRDWATTTAEEAELALQCPVENE